MISAAVSYRTMIGTLVMFDVSIAQWLRSMMVELLDSSFVFTGADCGLQIVSDCSCTANSSSCVGAVSELVALIMDSSPGPLFSIDPLSAMTSPSNLKSCRFRKLLQTLIRFSREL